MKHRQHGQVRDHGLHAQAAVEIGASSACNHERFGCNIRAIIPSPERDDGDEPRFVMRNHHQTASESVYLFSARAMAAGDRGFHAVRFPGAWATTRRSGPVIGETPEVPLAIDWGCKEALLWILRRYAVDY